MTPWHLDADLLQRYGDEALDLATAASAEAHLLGCATCRSGLAQLQPVPDLDDRWLDVVERIDAPRPGVVERLMRRLGVRETDARLLSAAPALRASWLLALVLVLAFAVAAARSVDDANWLFLLLAPLLPLAGVATAYGPGVDPAYDVAVAAPYSGTRLVLLRVVAVLATSTTLVLAAALALPTPGWSPLAWLLPSLGLSLSTLLLSTRFAPLRAGAAVGLGWAVLVIELDRQGHLLRLLGAPAQAAFLLVCVVAGTLLVVRRSLLDFGSHA